MKLSFKRFNVNLSLIKDASDFQDTVLFSLPYFRFTWFEHFLPVLSLLRNTGTTFFFTEIWVLSF
jgi:hypothetical protein